ncbi:MAG: hypothetical protein V4722_28490 [Bacteroidota bacterium]
MDSLTFHIEADKADVNLLESIKAYFGNRKIEILVKPERQLADIIAENRQSKESYVFKGNDFDNIASQIMNEEPVDFESLKKVQS